MNLWRMMKPLLLFGFLLLLPTQGNAQSTRPQGVPDLLDRAVQEEFVPVGVSPFGGDPDFPMLLLASRGKEAPQYLLVVVDARNGRETWSLRNDAPIFYLVFGDNTTLQQAFLDNGFAVSGEPSGSFVTAGPEGAEDLLARLREGYLRCRGLAGKLGRSV